MLRLNYFTYIQFLIISGFTINMQIGIKWIIRRSISFCFKLDSGLENELMWPCWVVEYIKREYVAVKNLRAPKGIIVIIETDITEVINMISLIRLIDGGAAILEAVNINHHSEMIGVTVINPFVRNILRVWVISYEIFAKINRPDEHSPCAIIIINAPHKPHLEFVNTPASINPICPTEE